MIRISNGKETLTVSSGAYKNQKGVYDSLGYHKVTDEGKKKEVPKNNNVDNNGNSNENKPEVVDLEKLTNKNIADWTKEELKGYAKMNNIDISKTKSSDEARKIISQYIASKE